MAEARPEARARTDAAGAYGPHTGAPRIPPGGRREIGAVNLLIARALGAATGGRPPNLFTTLARHRRLFRAWLRFAAALMPRGELPRTDAELVILRVAHRCGCEYEWRHHTHLAVRAGLSEQDVEAVRGPIDDPRWSPRQASLLAAADELHDHRTIGDATWRRLEELLSELERIELPLLIGHYQMLAQALLALRVEPDPDPTRPRGLIGRLAMRITDRR